MCLVSVFPCFMTRPCVCLGSLCDLTCGTCSHVISTWFAFCFPGKSLSVRISATRVPMLQSLPCTCTQCSPPTCTHLGPQPPILMRADAGGRAVPVCTHACFSPFWVHTLEHTSFCFLSPSSEDSAWEPPAPEASPSFSMPLTHCPATSAQEPVGPPSAQGRPRP